MSKKKKLIEVESLPIETVPHATYLINQNNPNSYTHGMFKYPCKFIPEIPRWAIKSFIHKDKSVILDPFSGSGTSLLEANLLGFTAFGTEIDDIARLITKVKTKRLTVNQFNALDKEFKLAIKAIKEESYGVYRPCINNIDHWFSEKTRIELGRLKTFIDSISDQDIKDFFKVCMISIIKKVSYADDMSPKPYVSTKIIKKPPTVEREFTNIFNRYLQMEQELHKIKNLGATKLLEGDALNFKLDTRVDMAITSPPYINAFDYGRTMRLENLWLGTLTEDSLRAKKANYVGTEKINTKKEEKDLGVLDDSKLLKKCYAGIYAQDEKRALVVKKFFEDMKINLKLVYKYLKADGKYVIVIGNSKIRNIDIESWKIIEEIGHKVGFKTATTFSYVIRNPYIRIPRKGMGGKIGQDYITVLNKETTK